MSDLEFRSGEGDLLAVSPDGLVAFLDSEYADWTVSPLPQKDDAIYVRLGSEVLKLEPHPTKGDRLRVPPKIRKKSGGKREEESRSKSYIGVVTLYSDIECTVPLSPILHVNSTNLSKNEFSEILSDLRNQIFAISIYSAQLKVHGSDASDASKVMPLARFLRVLSSLEPVIDTYQKQLRLIHRNPSRRIKRVNTVMTIERAISSGFIGQTFRVPDWQRKLQVVGREWTADTLERRFMISSGSQLLIESRATLAYLRSRLADTALGDDDSDVGRLWFKKLDEVRDKYISIMKNKGVKNKTSIDGSDSRSVRQMVERISRKVDGLEKQIGYPVNDLNGTRIRTNKLELSPEYSPALRAWTEYRRQSTGFENARQLIDQLDERTIAPSAILYERWVTVRLYSELLRRGFYPSLGRANLIDLISITDGEVVLQRGELDVELSAVFGGSSVQLRVRHEPIINRLDGKGYRTPDLVFDITVSTEYRGETLVSVQRWVLDAKFKDYRIRAPRGQLDDEKRFGSHFLADLLGVAEFKYRRELGVDGSVIVHPNLSKEFLYLDQELTDPWRKSFIESTSAHSVLSVPLRPGSLSDRQVTRLLKIIFGYHFSLGKICWTCGIEAEVHAVPGAQGDGCTCNICGSFWIVHRCFACGHKPLLKFASDPIHKVETGQPFNVHCPECGAFFDEKSK